MVSGFQPYRIPLQAACSFPSSQMCMYGIVKGPCQKEKKKNSEFILDLIEFPPLFNQVFLDLIDFFFSVKRKNIIFPPFFLD